MILQTVKKHVPVNQTIKYTNIVFKNNDREIVITLAEQDFGMLQLLLDGGVPLLLLIALIIISKAYYEERNKRTDAMENYKNEISSLKTEYSSKVESLFRERLESEIENTKVIMRATEALDSVTTALQQSNETIIKFADRADND